MVKVAHGLIWVARLRDLSNKIKDGSGPAGPTRWGIFPNVFKGNVAHALACVAHRFSKGYGKGGPRNRAIEPCLRRAIACLTFPARSATVRFLSPPDHRNLTCILGETWAVTP